MHLKPVMAPASFPASRSRQQSHNSSDASCIKPLDMVYIGGDLGCYSWYQSRHFTLLHFSRGFHRVEWDSTDQRYLTSHYHSAAVVARHNL